MSKSDLKKKKDLFKDLDKLYIKNKPRIIEWLVDIATQYNGVHNNKIDNLLITSKIQINTTSEYGVYNLILQWFLNNKEKFIIEDELDLFDNIPSTTFTKISKQIMMQSSSPLAASYQSLNIEEAIKKWKENPHKNPYDDTDIKISIVPTSHYGLLYEKFCNHLSSNIESPILPITFEKEIRNKLPNNHIYAFKDIDYIEKLKSNYQDEEWIKFLDTKKNLFYKNEKVNDVTGSTVYDFLFMHFFLIKNKKKFDKNIVIDYIDEQLFLYETILAQIKHIKAVDLNCYEIFESMVSVTTNSNGTEGGDNFKLIKKKKGTKEWQYEIPPLLKLFTEYINEITYYILPISNLNKIIYNDFFLYGEKTPQTSIYDLMNSSIEYNIYRLKTIINIIFSSLYTNDINGVSRTNDIKVFLNILFYNISECIGKRNTWYKNNDVYEFDEDKLITINNILAYTQTDLPLYGVDEYKFKMFFVSAIFDIKTLHEESSETNYIKYEFIKDPYDNLPDPPQIPKPVKINQGLQRYKMTSHIVGKNSQKENELKEFEKKQKNYNKELKEYDKRLKEYNDKYLDKKLSPYFSVKLSRAKSVINNKNSLRLNYSPLKVSAKSLTKFKSSKNKALLSKFEKEPYSRTYKKKKEDENASQKEKEYRQSARERESARQERESARQEREREIEREWLRARSDSISSFSSMASSSNRSSNSARSSSSGYSSGGAPKKAYLQMFQGGGSKEPLSKSDLKLKLALEADNAKFKKYAKSLSPSGKSPRQKYIGCDLNDNDPITQEAFSDMHFKKIKYLSKIKTTLENGKIITNCYDTVPLYNYILDCNNKCTLPINIAQGREPFDILQLDEVYKKIKNFTKKPTLKRDIDTSHKIFLNTLYVQHGYEYELHGFPFYTIYATIIIGSIPIPISHDNYNHWQGGMLKIIEAPIISRDDILFEDTSDNTTLLIEKGVKKGSLLKVNKYPYWHREGRSTMPDPLNNLVALPPFSWTRQDNFDRLKERTHVLNNSIERLI